MSWLRYYGLAKQPFGATPDPEFMYLSATHREALASLLHGIASDRGFSALIAEPGMGKTTLLFHLQQMLRGRAKTAFLFQALGGPRDFLAALLADLGLDHGGDGFPGMQAKLNSYLLQEARNDRRVVVLIDEAQNLDNQVLEVIRMLSNFETTNRKLLHVVLAGQPQLAKRLAAERLVQLRQRISIVARLERFGPGEIAEYIEHRLRAAGRSLSDPLFVGRTYAMIAEHSQGIPRNINNLCFNAMSLACALKRHTVDASVLQEVFRDFELNSIACPQKNGAPRTLPRLHSRMRLLSPRIWQGATAVLALLLTVVLVVGKASDQRIERTSRKEPHENAGAPLEAISMVPEADEREFSRPSARQISPEQAVMRLGSLATAEKRRSIPRPRSRPRGLKSHPQLDWTSKFSPLLKPPRMAEVQPTPQAIADIQEPFEKPAVPLEIAAPGERP